MIDKPRIVFRKQQPKLAYSLIFVNNSANYLRVFLTWKRFLWLWLIADLDPFIEK